MKRLGSGSAWILIDQSKSESSWAKCENQGFHTCSGWKLSWAEPSVNYFRFGSAWLSSDLRAELSRAEPECENGQCTCMHVDILEYLYTFAQSISSRSVLREYMIAKIRRMSFISPFIRSSDLSLLQISWQELLTQGGATVLFITGFILDKS